MSDPHPIHLTEEQRDQIINWFTSHLPTGVDAAKAAADAGTELGRIDQALRDAGIEYPLAAQGVRDLAMQRTGAWEARDEALAGSDTLVRRHAAAVLQDWADRHAQLERTLSALEAKGKRIVDLDRGNGNVEGFWAIMDYRDPDIIVSGTDPQELNRIVNSAAAADWEFLNDHIDDVTDSREKVLTKGLPESLCAAIAEWIEQPTLSSEELAEFVGWPVERVKALRDD